MSVSGICAWYLVVPPERATVGIAYAVRCGQMGGIVVVVVRVSSLYSCMAVWCCS